MDEHKSFFSNDGVKPILAKPKLVLSTVEQRQPISVYSLVKILNISYPTLARICKELEFVGLIKSRIEIGSNNKAVKILFIPGQESTKEGGEITSNSAPSNSTEVKDEQR